MIFLPDTNAFSDLMRKHAKATRTDDEYYEKEYRIKGRCHGKNFRLGDSMRVNVARIIAFHSAIDFELAQKSKIGSS